MGQTITIDFHGDWNTVLSLDRVAPKTERNRLYFVEFEDGSLKIGVTRNLKGRVTNLCQTRRGFGLCAMPHRVVFSEPHINVLENERALLEDYGFERAGGEHVRASLDDVRTAAESLDFRTEPMPEEVERSCTMGAAWDRVLQRFGFRHLSSPMTEAETVAALDMVAIARRTHGTAAARELWVKLGLPTVPEMKRSNKKVDLFNQCEEV